MDEECGKEFSKWVLLEVHFKCSGPGWDLRFEKEINDLRKLKLFILNLAFCALDERTEIEQRVSRDGFNVRLEKQTADGVYRLKLIACFKWRHNRREIYSNVKREKAPAKSELLILIKFCGPASSQSP